MANLTLRPESVIRWTMLTSRTSSASSGRSMSTISGSLSGSLLLSASLIVVILPSTTSLPSLFLGIQSLISRTSDLALRTLEHGSRALMHVLAAYPVIAREHHVTVRDVYAGVEHALQGCEDRRALRGLSQPEVQDGLFYALLLGPLPR